MRDNRRAAARRWAMRGRMALAGAGALLLCGLLAGCGGAGPATVVGDAPRHGTSAEVAVRLAGADGAPVVGASIDSVRTAYRPQLHKTMPGLGAWRSVAAPAAVESPPGIYRIALPLPQPGAWTLAMAWHRADHPAPATSQVSLPVR